jgi:hypothetical protein
MPEARPPALTISIPVPWADKPLEVKANFSMAIVLVVVLTLGIGYLALRT